MLVDGDNEKLCRIHCTLVIHLRMTKQNNIPHILENTQTNALSVRIHIYTHTHEPIELQYGEAKKTKIYCNSQWHVFTLVDKKVFHVTFHFCFCVQHTVHICTPSGNGLKKMKDGGREKRARERVQTAEKLILNEHRKANAGVQYIGFCCRINMQKRGAS